MKRPPPRLAAAAATAAGALAALAGAACAPPAGGGNGASPAATARRSGIELSEHGTIFTLATTLTSQRSRAARLREHAARATGAIFSLYVTPTGEPELASNGTRARGSCGATFVSPSYAVTAAHCVDGAGSDMRTLSVEMYRPGPALDQAFLAATPLAGAYPDYQHARLGAGDGYFTDRFACTLVSRCSPSYGGPVNCDGAAATGGDVALVRCDGAPGWKYGWVDLAAADDAAAPVFMPWKHEVYDVPKGDPSDDRYRHYVAYAGGRANNYHYFGQSSAGVEQNQLLPLISIDFPDGTPHHKIDVTASTFISTDLFGCHGTSGSGVMQEGERGFWQLLGPAVYGNGEHASYLCDHVPALDGASREPGAGGLAYMGLPSTRYVVTRSQAELRANCAPLPAGASSLFTHLACAAEGLAAQGANAAFAARLGAPAGPRGALDPLADRVAALGAGESAAVTGFAFTAGERYRVGVEAWTPSTCAATTGTCGDFSVRVGTAGVVSGSFAGGSGPPPRPVPFAATFQATVTGTLPVTLAAGGADAVELGALAVRPEAATNTFDSMLERAEVALQDLNDVPGDGGVGAPPQPGLTPVAQPARFAGDGKAGFAARLLANERLVLARLALAPGRRWSARFTAGTPATLTCGLLAADGAVVTTADCSTGFVQVDDRGGGTAAGTGGRAAFYIQAAPGAPATSIDDFQIVSDLMPDGDGDSIPDAVDKCPDGPTPPGGVEPLRFDFMATLERHVCTPEPPSMLLLPPRALNACDPPRMVGHVAAVNGKPLGGGGFPVPGNPDLLLPAGSSTIIWEAYDAGGHVRATLEQTVVTTYGVDATCCLDPERMLVEGTAGDDALVSAAIHTCVLAGDGDDFVVSGDTADFVFGGAGDDYLDVGSGAAEYADFVIGGDGNDYLTARSRSILLAFGGDGDDTIHAAGVNGARLYGGPGDDVLIGGAGADRIFPGPGVAVVLAGEGDDTVTLRHACELTRGSLLDGGGGNDTLRSPVPREELAAAGVEIAGFESVIVDPTLGYLSPCF